MTTPPEEIVSAQKRDQRRTGVILLLVALALAMTLGVAYRTDKRADAGDHDRATQGHQMQALQGQVKMNGQIATAARDAAEEANRRLAAAGKPTVPLPSVTPINPTIEAPAAGLTVDDVRAIVTLELGQQKVTLTQAEISQIARVAAALVPKPADGKPPTPAQIQPVVTSVVAAYCVGDKCVGKPGTDGKPGRDGTDGAPGADAPKVTDEELLAAAKQALAAYCAQDTKPCTPKDGADGKDGTNGVGIADMDCVGTGDDSYWRIYLSNDTTKDVAGPCRIAPILPPASPSGDR